MGDDGRRRTHFQWRKIYRVAIFGRVLVHLDTAWAVHVVIFGGFFSRQTCGESQIAFVVDEESNASLQ